MPATMKAAVYVGKQTVQVDEMCRRPQIGAGELLVRVEACGICHTDLKKIEYDLLPAPRIYGHETAGTVVAAGEGVRNLQPGDRVIAFHHIPCLDCFYCDRKLYAQCPVYKKVGITAGFEPAGGGFAQYIRIMDWIVERGVEKIPDGVSFRARFLVEPVNTVSQSRLHGRSAARGCVRGAGPGPDRSDVHDAGRAEPGARDWDRHHCQPGCNFRGSSERRWPRIRERMMSLRCVKKIPMAGARTGNRGGIAPGIGRAGSALLPARSKNSAVLSDIGQGTNRGFRRRHLCR